MGSDLHPDGWFGSGLVNGSGSKETMSTNSKKIDVFVVNGSDVFFNHSSQWY